MNIHVFPSGPFETNSYLAVCKTTRQAAIIDTAPGSYQKIHSYIAEKKIFPSKILLTHSHWDHIADAALFKKHTSLQVCIHPLDTLNLEKPGSDRLPCWISFEGVLPDVLLKENQIIQIGQLAFRVIHTPGHTPGGVCFYCEEEGALFSGDTLFQGTIGSLSFPTAQPHLMWDSLKKLAALPPDTIVYPGHGPSTTIGEESWLSHAKERFENP